MRTIDVGASRLTILRGDITRLGRHVGAIVNAANQSLVAGGGVAGMISRVGGSSIDAECRRLAPVQPGGAVATTAGLLDADAVIHAVGPIWRGGTQGEDSLLAAAYHNTLAVVAERGLTSVAFPSISTGSFRFPLDRAATIAVSTVAGELSRGSSIEEVIFALYSDADYAAYDAALAEWERSHDAAFQWLSEERGHNA
jgi:O-acetyl-ADP-ribose deacetylase (regulator of RNase III)